MRAIGVRATPVGVPGAAVRVTVAAMLGQAAGVSRPVVAAGAAAASIACIVSPAGVMVAVTVAAPHAGCA